MSLKDNLTPDQAKALKELDDLTWDSIKVHDYIESETFACVKIEGEDVVSLNLIGKRLEYLPETISHFKSLKYLNLNYNRLTTLPDSILKLKSLDPIIIDVRQLSDFTEAGLELYYDANPEHFRILLELKDVIGNPILRTKTIEFYNVYNVKIENRNIVGLGLAGHGLKEVPQSIKNLFTLEELSLKKFESVIFPEFIGDLENLKMLSLTDNKLNNLPVFIKNLSNLRVLYISWNTLSTLPDFLTSLKSLGAIFIDEKQLEKLDQSGLKQYYRVIPEQFEVLMNLREKIGHFLHYVEEIKDNNVGISVEDEKIVNLNIFGHRLEEFPESICKLTSLKNLILNGNRFTTIPESIANLTLLERLDLDNNKLTILPRR